MTKEQYEELKIMMEEHFERSQALIRLNNPNLHLLTVKDAGLVLRVSPKTVKKIIKNGHLDATPFGKNKTMIVNTDLDKFIANLDGRSLNEFM